MIAPTDRPYQSQVFDSVTQKIAQGHKRILLICPTGGGKGYMGARFMQKAVAKRNDCVFFADQRELIYQIDAQMDRLGIATNVVMRGAKNEYDSYEADVASRLCNIIAKDTLHARAVRTQKMRIPPAVLVQVDEAHKSISRTWQHILAQYNDSIVLGWTATPCRSDGRSLGSYWQSMVKVASYKQLQADGYLVPVRIYAPNRPNLVGLRRTGGDYHKKDLQRVMNKEKLVGEIIREWKRHANDRQTVCFASGVDHSIHLRDEFRKAGISAEHIDGSMDQSVRDEIMSEARAGRVKVLCNYGVLHTGVDVPNLKVMICARPTKSFSLWRQMAGRIQRPAPGHDECLILDHSHNTFEFGFPDEDVDWQLGSDEPIHLKHKLKQAQQKKEPKECPKKGCKKIITGRECECGYVFPDRKGRSRKCEKEALAALSRSKMQRKTNRLSSMSDKQRYWIEVLGWAIGSNKKVGAAAHRFRDKFGVWPNSSLEKLP